ncbi:MAG: hypothetical protein WDZ70_02285 [Candidatus Paceibacterota bacterium]
METATDSSLGRRVFIGTPGFITPILAAKFLPTVEVALASILVIWIGGTLLCVFYNGMAGESTFFSEYNIKEKSVFHKPLRPDIKTVILSLFIGTCFALPTTILFFPGSY